MLGMLAEVKWLILMGSIPNHGLTPSPWIPCCISDFKHLDSL